MTNVNKAWLDMVESQDLKILEREPYCLWTPKLKKTLSKHRYQHVLGVTQTAMALAKRYGQDLDQAVAAAYLHDCAKKNESYYFKQLKDMGILEEKDYKATPTYHSFLGGYVARYIYGLEDPLVIKAIQSHTQGSTNMSKLDKIIFISDLIEPHRDFEGLEELRKASLEGLTKGTLAAFDHTLTFLIRSGKTIELLSVEARNSIILEMRACGAEEEKNN